jgi:transaldolase/glucose-6-phosphate isomerase
MSTIDTNPLKALQAYGQSVWLDYIRRSLLTDGELRRLVEEDGLRGVTSNPAIFEKAITGNTDYESALADLATQNLDAKSLYEHLAVRDIQDAADLLRPVYEQTRRRDGYVSLEVSPTLARDTQGTLEEARRLWKTGGGVCGGRSGNKPDEDRESGGTRSRHITTRGRLWCNRQLSLPSSLTSGMSC